MAWIVGIDEAGRGPLAGPLAVAGVSCTPQFASRFLIGIKDSKRLSAKKRVEWYGRMAAHPRCASAVAFIGPGVIDRVGIAHAARLGVARVLRKLAVEPRRVLLDGSLVAPRRYVQEVVVRGDERIPLIAAASIIAKVRRDRLMVRAHRRFPQYAFATHKGYGTRLHRRYLGEYGPCIIHRETFLTRILAKS